MTPEEQRIALAEWMGFRLKPAKGFMAFDAGAYGGVPTVWHDSSGEEKDLPNTNSLDVIHEMERKLTPNQWDKYADLICDYCVCDHDPDIRAIITLTAAERRCFILKALGLWREAG